MARLRVERGHEGRRDHAPCRPQGPALPGCGLRGRELSRPGRVGGVIAGHDALVHVAGIRLAPYVASVPVQSDIPSVVVVSSAAVRSLHRAAATEYRAGEDAIRQVRSDAVLVRPTVISGSLRDWNVHLVIDLAHRYRALPLVSEGPGLIQPMHYADLAAVIVKLIGARVAAPVDIGGGGEALTVRTGVEAGRRTSPTSPTGTA